MEDLSPASDALLRGDYGLAIKLLSAHVERCKVRKGRRVKEGRDREDVQCAFFALDRRGVSRWIPWSFGETFRLAAGMVCVSFTLTLRTGIKKVIVLWRIWAYHYTGSVWRCVRKWLFLFLLFGGG